MTGAAAGLSAGLSASFVEPLAQERLTPRPAQHDALLVINERWLEAGAAQDGPLFGFSRQKQARGQPAVENGRLVPPGHAEALLHLVEAPPLEK